MATKNKPKAGLPAAGANGPAAPTGDVLTLAEAAAYLRVPDEAVRTGAEAGRLPGRKIGSEWRFSKTALLEWLGQPEPRTGLARTGPELIERIRAIREGSRFQETEEEAEAFLAEIYAARKANPVGG